jgi:metal-sulfur cluster biosynthetic enzyme
MRETMTAQMSEVQVKLSEVYDPELDQPLTELGFIGGVIITGDRVEVQFRLPTYFCAANFAFMMAADIRDRVSELPWVSQVRVTLVDHFASEEINQGVNCGQSFSDTFEGLAEGELEEVRQTFRLKAFISRQERVLRHLLSLGLSNDRIVAITLGELEGLLRDREDGAGMTIFQRYMAIRAERGLSLEPEQPFFSEPDGVPMEKERFRAYLQNARSVRINMEFNTNFCRGVLQTRYALANESDSA